MIKNIKNTYRGSFIVSLIFIFAHFCYNKIVDSKELDRLNNKSYNNYELFK